MVALGLGWLAGLAVNGLADSLPDERRTLGPACQACGLPVPAGRWSALIAVLAGRARCPYCGAARGWRPPLVEAGLALAAAGLWLWAGGQPGRWASAGLLTSIFALIAVIDIEHRLVLWRVVWPSALALAVMGGLDPAHGWAPTLLGGLAGYGFMGVLYLGGRLYTRLASRVRGRPLEEEALGAGDVNLAGLVGLAVGWPHVVGALFLGVAGAGLFGLAVLLVQAARRRYSLHTAFAYGPFLILGALIRYFLG